MNTHNIRNKFVEFINAIVHKYKEMTTPPNKRLEPIHIAHIEIDEDVRNKSHEFLYSEGYKSSQDVQREIRQEIEPELKFN